MHMLAAYLFSAKSLKSDGGKIKHDKAKSALTSVISSQDSSSAWSRLIAIGPVRSTVGCSLCGRHLHAEHCPGTKHPCGHAKHAHPGLQPQCASVEFPHEGCPRYCESSLLSCLHQCGPWTMLSEAHTSRRKTLA